MKTLLRVFILMVLFGIDCQHFCGALELSPALQKEDPRLQSLVTVESPHLYLEELFRLLSSQTKIELHSNVLDDASGVAFAVSFKNKPLVQVLNAIWSAVSYKSSDWEWEREGKPGDYRYRLVQPRTHKFTSNDLQELAQQEFERQLRLLIPATKMSADEKAELKKQEPELAPSLDNPQKMKGLSLLTDLAGTQALVEMLRGSQTLKYRVDELPQAGQEFVKEMNRASESPKMPETLKIFTQKNPGGTTPTLFISMEHLGGLSYAGGPRLERDLQRARTQDWLRNGDTLSSPLEKNELISDKAQNPEELLPKRGATLQSNQALRVALAYRI